MSYRNPFLLLASAALILGPADLLPAQGTNLSFETASEEDSDRPKGWQFRGAGYEITLDTIARDGLRSLRMVRESAGGAAAASQSVSAASMSGPRVRLTGYLRTENVTDGTAGLWLVIYGAGDQMLYWDGMAGTGASGTQDWTRYAVELPVPPEATRIEFGAHLTGAGAAWIDALALEAVADTSISDSVRDYLEHALDLMETHSIRRDSIDWSSFRASVLDRARGAQSVSDVHPVLEVAVRRLGDRHSHFRRPAPRPAAGAIAPSPPQAFPSGSMAGDRVGYLRVPGFAGAAPERTTAFADSLQRAIARLDSSGVCGWIVELRENTGGNMWPMIAGLGPLLGPTRAGWFVYPDGRRVPWGYRDGASLHDGEPRARISHEAYQLREPDPPVAVLTNAQTMSSGEAVAVAFRGRPHARSFGRPTAGLSTSNRTIVLSDSAALVITVAAFADRTGRTYGGLIEPDTILDSADTAPPSPDDAVASAARTWLETQPACTGHWRQDALHSHRDRTSRWITSLKFASPVVTPPLSPRAVTRSSRWRFR